MRWARSFGFLLVGAGELTWLVAGFGRWQPLADAWFLVAFIGAFAAAMEARTSALLTLALGHVAAVVLFLGARDAVGFAVSAAILGGLTWCAAGSERRRWTESAVALLLAGAAASVWLLVGFSGLHLPLLVLGTSLFCGGCALASLGLADLAAPARRAVAHPRPRSSSARLGLRP